MRTKLWSRIALFSIILCMLVSFTIPVAAARKATIKLWILPWVDNFGAGSKELLKDFEQKNNVEVLVEEIPWSGCLEKYKAAVISGNAPDVAATTVNRYPPLAKLGFLEPLDSRITATFKRQFLDPNVLEMGKFEGHYYCLPTLIEPRTLFYNKTLFEQAGIKELPKTWDEFLSVGKKIHESTGKYGYAFPGIQRSFLRFTFWLNQADGRVFSEDGTKCVINNKNGVEALSFLVKMMKEGVMPQGCVGMTEEEVEALFSSGETAMMINGPNFLPILDKFPNLRYGVGPIFRGRTTITSGGPEQYFIFKSSKDKTLAWKLLNYMATDKNFVRRRCEKFVYLPVIKDTGIKWTDPRMKYFEDTIATGVRDVEGWPAMDQATPILAGAIQGALMGKISPQQAFDDAAAQINEILAREN